MGACPGRRQWRS